MKQLISAALCAGLFATQPGIIYAAEDDPSSLPLLCRSIPLIIHRLQTRIPSKDGLPDPVSRVSQQY